MKIFTVAAATLGVLWLGLWVSDTGILASSSSTKIPMTRECHYFIGVSVLKRIEPLADRCPVVKTVGR